MPPVLVPVPIAQQLPHVAAVVMVCIVAGVFVRVALCVLAAFAVHKALRDATEDTESIRAHRLAVLQTILDALAGHAWHEPPGDDESLHTK